MLDDLLLQTDTAMHTDVRGYSNYGLPCIVCLHDEAKRVCMNVWQRPLNVTLECMQSLRLIQQWCGLHCGLEAIGAFTFDALLM